MSDPRREAGVRRLPDGSAVPPCRPDDLVVSLRWERSGDGLAGEVVAENVGGRTCQLGGKPTVRPLGRNGEALPAEHLISLELRIPSAVVLRPGGRAAAPVSWAGWCGDPASGRVVIGWDGGSVVVDAQGPSQPRCPDEGAATNLSSSWFNLVD